MDLAEKATYSGRWLSGSEHSEAGSLWSKLPGGLQSDLQIQVVLFNNGNSLIRGISADKTLFVSTRDKITQFLFKPGENKVVFTPLESNPLPPFYGFILPSNLTGQFTRIGDSEMFDGQARCRPKEKGCQEWVVDLANGGMMALVTERKEGYDFRLTYKGTTGARSEWRFSDERSQGFPDKIEYREFRLEQEAVAHVLFHLTKTESSKEEPNFRKLLPEDVQVQIRRDNVSYGGGLDKDSTTLWQTYEAQEAMHSQVAQSEQSVFPLAAAVTLLFGIVVFAAVVLIRKRRGQ